MLFWDELGSIACLDEVLEPGDRVVFYTDGITERRAADDSLFDLSRVMDVLTRHGADDVSTMVGTLVREVEAFGGETEPEDDQTVLAVRIR
jgi:serine phosphatase RsbU (regulator of sigma subunit)